MLLFTACLLVNALLLQGQISETGTSLNRSIGPATFRYRIDTSGTGVLCSFLWNDSLVGMTHLNAGAPKASFSFADSAQTGVCELSLRLSDAGTELSQLETTIQSKSRSRRNTTLNYDGLVTAWLPQKTVASTTTTIPVADSVVYPLTPVLTVVTKPIGTAKNNASVTIYSGSVLIYTVTLTQAAPFVTYNSDIILGEVKIEKGMQLTLQIPSTLQPGSILMQATFSSLNIPPTPINALVATWNL